MLEALFGKTVGYLGYSLSILALVLALVLTGHFSFWTIREISPESMKNWLGKLAKSTGRKAGSTKPARWVFVLLALPLPILVFFFSRMSITGLVWAEALVFTILLLSIFPRMTKRDGKPPRSNTAVFFVPMVVATIATTLIHIGVVKWILAIIVGSILLWFLIRRLKGKVSLEKIPGKEYAPDTATIVLSCLGLISLNLIGYFGTSVQPRYWNWYYSDKQFFWVFNLGLLFVCILTSYRNEKSEIKPFAKSLRRFVMVATLVILAFNIYWRPLPGFTEARTGTANSRTYRPVTSSNVAYSSITKKPLPPQPVADGESGTCGVLGSAKQFLPGTTTPVRNPQNGAPGTGAVGYWAINLSSPAVKSIVDGYKVDGKSLDVENNKDHNDAAASLLYEESGLRPWIASKHCWGDKVDGYLAKQSLPYVLDVVNAPVGTWSEKVRNPMVSTTDLGFSKTDDNKGGACEYMMDGNPKEVFPFGVSKENRYPSHLQFRCKSEGAEIRVRVVPK